MYNFNKYIKKILKNKTPSRVLATPSFSVGGSTPSPTFFKNSMPKMNMKFKSLNVFNNSFPKMKNFKLPKFGGKNDWDFDGVPNRRDCQPRNTMRQDSRPNKLQMERIRKLPFYSVDKKRFGDDTIYEAALYGTAKNIKSWHKYGNAPHISDKNFPSEKRKEIYGMIKKHPHLMTDIEESKSNIIYADKIKDNPTVGFNYPILNKEKKIIGSSIVSFNEPKRTNFSKDTDAETLFHELKHEKQDRGLTSEQYVKEKSYYNEEDLKSYFEHPSEIDATEEQFSKLGERLGEKGEQTFRNIDKFKQKSYLSQKKSDRPAKDFKKERIDFRQEEYDKYKEEEKKDKVDIDINKDVTSGFELLEKQQEVNKTEQLEEQQEVEEKPKQQEEQQEVDKPYDDNDGDGIINVEDCEPNNPDKQDSQIFLQPSRYYAKKYPELKSKDWKNTQEKSVMLMVHEVPKQIFIGKALRGVEYDDPDEIKHLSNVISHEEMHHVIGKEQDLKTSQQLDNVTQRTKTVTFKDGSRIIRNPKGGATIDKQYDEKDEYTELEDNKEDEE